MLLTQLALAASALQPMPAMTPGQLLIGGPKVHIVKFSQDPPEPGPKPQPDEDFCEPLGDIPLPPVDPCGPFECRDPMLVFWCQVFFRTQHRANREAACDAQRAASDLWDSEFERLHEEAQNDIDDCGQLPPEEVGDCIDDVMQQLNADLIDLNLWLKNRYTQIQSDYDDWTTSNVDSYRDCVHSIPCEECE